MRNTQLRGLAVAAVVVASACSTTDAVAPPTVADQTGVTADEVDANPTATWSRSVIPLLSGGTLNEAYGISDKGAVVGLGDYVPSAGFTVVSAAFVYSGGVLTNVHAFGPTPFASKSAAMDVNAAGTVVGWYLDGGGDQHGFYWSAAAGFQYLPGGLGTAAALGINNAGAIVGFYLPSPSSGVHAFVWTAASGLVDAHPDPAALDSRAYDINDGGVIVGVVGGKVAQWTLGGPVTYLPNPPGQDIAGFSFAFPPLGISSGGAIVGGFTSAGVDTPWRWKAGVGSTLKFAPGDATDASIKGRSVGWQNVTAPAGKRAVTQLGASVVTLPNLATGKPSWATAVNKCGNIAGVGVNAASRHRAVVWTISGCDP